MNDSADWVQCGNCNEYGGFPKPGDFRFPSGGCSWCEGGWMLREWPQWPAAPHRKPRDRDGRRWVYASGNYKAVWIEVLEDGKPIEVPVPDHFTVHKGQVWCGMSNGGWVSVTESGKAAHYCTNFYPHCMAVVEACGDPGWRPLCKEHRDSP